MLVVRCVREDDLDQLHELIQQAEYGLTSLRVSKEELEARIQKSAFAFSQPKISKPAGEVYVFVMEDLAQKRIVGTSSIYSKVGGFEPNYSYEIEESIHDSVDLGVHKVIEILHLREDHDGPTLLGSLFLSPEYWGGGYGRLLSMSRFLFMAEFPQRMEKEVIAEMRGVVDKEGHSPLWAALGSHFFQIDFPKADTLTARSKKFIAELMPEHPIYIPLLPISAQEVIGQVHQNTRPALAMLQKEGFEYQRRVDIFDGGPTLHCQLEDIRTIRECKQGTVAEILPEVQSGNQQLISNTRLVFRACLGSIVWQNGQANIDPLTALQLDLKVGDTLRSVSLKPE